MEHEQVEKAVARKSALIYLPISIGAAYAVRPSSRHRQVFDASVSMAHAKILS